MCEHGDIGTHHQKKVTTRVAHAALNGLEQLLGGMQRFFVGQGRIIAGLVVLLFPAVLFFAPKIPPALRVEDLNGSFLDSFVRQQELKKDFAIEDQLTVIFESAKPLESEDYCRLHKWVMDLNSNPAVKLVSSAFDLRYPDSPQANKLYYPKVFEAPCEGKINFEKLANHPVKSLYDVDNRHEMTFNLQFFPTPAGSFLHYDYEQINHVVEQARKLADKLYLGGALFFQKSALEGFKKAIWLNLLTAVIFALAYYYFYRSKIAATVLLLIVFFTHSLIRIFMHWDHQKMDPLATCLFLMITIAIIEDFIFLSYLLFSKKMPYKEALRKLLLPSFLTSLTTAIGFGSLALSANPNIQHFAIWSSFGSMLEWFLMMIILPCLMELFSKKVDPYSARIQTAGIKLDKLSSWTPPRILTFVFTGLVILLPFLKDHANFNYSPLDMFKPETEIQQFANHLKSKRDIEGELSIVFDDSGARSGAVLAEAELADFRAIPGVKNLISMANFEKELISFEPSLQRLILSNIESTKLGKIFSSGQRHRIIAQIDSIEIKQTQRIQNEIEDICRKRFSGQCWPAGDVVVSKDLSLSIIDTIYSSFTFCLLLIGVIMVWLTLAINRRLVVPVLLSVIWAPVVLLITVVALNLKITVVTCVVLATLLGLSGDNAIQFLLLKEKRLLDSISDNGVASVQNFILLALVACTLFFSEFKTSQELSMLIIYSSILMLIGDVWILRGWLKTFGGVG